VLGITTDGGLSEYLSVPAELIHPLPEGVDEISGTFVEPLASALQTVEKIPAELDEHVLIIGSGKLGLLMAQVYDASGAETFVVGHNRWQLGLARQLGLKNTINVEEEDWKKRIMDATSNVGPRVVIEATGNPEGLEMALQVVRSKGTIGLKSMHGNPVEIDPTVMVHREISILGTSNGPFERAIDMLSKGRIEVNRLVTKEFKLEDGTKAFEYADQPATTKVIINI
jgi:threonine dehydrogenase-like Zn-dependent dehydrogenase